MVSGSLARISTSMARFCTSISLVAQQRGRSPAHRSGRPCGPAPRARPSGSSCWCPQLRLQRALDLRLVETRQDVDDVHPRDRILALEPAGEFAQRSFVVGDFADDPEQRGLLVGLLGIGGRAAVRAALKRSRWAWITSSSADLDTPLAVSASSSRSGRVAAAAGQRPGDAGRRSAGRRRTGLRTNCGKVLLETSVESTSTSATVAFLSASASAWMIGLDGARDPGP